MSIQLPWHVEWDPVKAAANERVHGIAFSEAATVLEDDRAITREDSDSVDEQRFVILGLSASGSLLVVVYTWRDPAMLRMISAWRANVRQRKIYAQGNS